MDAPRTRGEMRPNCNGNSPALWNELSLWHAIEMQPSAHHAPAPGTYPRPSVTRGLGRDSHRPSSAKPPAPRRNTVETPAGLCGSRPGILENATWTEFARPRNCGAVGPQLVRTLLDGDSGNSRALAIESASISHPGISTEPGGAAHVESVAMRLVQRGCGRQKRLHTQRQ
ncbi:hypothetical protein Ptr86124_004626 [Pyrenophora tritici-repentis]|uniref:Uncharacterized protein n=1 Tax=Pyrenophora tritici-repentis TaxID=45151 RepID=A0A922SXG1_9PLEO|nr:hypothetical protein Ptr86124_004626 [Pyrenophora tritici-repentis]